MKKGFFTKLCLLLLCMSLGLMTKCQIVKADLILDEKQIDGAHAIFFDQQPLREIQYNGTVVWRAGANITYIIDNDVSEVHFVPYGQTTLGAMGSKAGYEFVGWRTDATASGNVLTEDLCTGDEKTLYAVFRKAVTVSYYNGSSTKQTSVKYIFYNNGNTSNPEFTISQASLSGWTARGWSTGQAANAGVSYSVLNGTTFTSDVTLYGVYQKTITASFTGNGSTGGSVAAMTGTAYYNSAGNTINPSFDMPKNGFAKSGYAWTGWMQGSTGVVLDADESVTLSADTTFAAQWQSAVHNFAYTGNVQTWTVPTTGYYQLEVWGASGGDGYSEFKNDEGSHYTALAVNGGRGGYSVGYVQLNAGEKLYVCVGEKGEDRYGLADPSYSEKKLGAYNGGGGAGPGFGACGGGATHIATANRGVLSNYNSYRSEVLIVAGGGGGSLLESCDEEGSGECPYDGDHGILVKGGNGGGLSGETPLEAICPYTGRNQGYTPGDGGTQTSGGYNGSFGTAVQDSGRVNSGGGGGGWYGGSCGLQEAAGGGGSGYIGGVLSTLNYNGQTYTSKTATSSHAGNGAVTITYLGR